MFNGESGYSLSDIAAVSGKNNENMWNDGGAWWIIILFLFCFAGWGGNGWGGNNGSTTREDITYGLDMSNLKCGQTSLASDVANGFYSLNSGMLTGFANTNTNVSNGVQDIQSDICNMSMSNLQNTQAITDAINNNNTANMQNMFTLSTQLNNMQAQQKQCCCDTNQLIASNFAELEYNLASQACENRQTTLNGVRDIIDNNNNNTKQILDFLVQDKLDTLNAENAALRGQISQGEQNAYLLSQLRPNANPAYIVANPYTGVAYTSYGCGYGSNCACSTNF